MSDEIKFTACEHLDFSGNYSAKKTLISLGETKVCWDRPVPYSSYPQLVQYCKKRGRMNNPEMCTCENKKQCNDYSDHVHSVVIETVGVS